MATLRGGGGIPGPALAPTGLYDRPFYHHTQGDHIAKVVDHSVDACCDSLRRHLAACCPNVDAVDVSYEVEALGCIHDLKGEVVMHERRRIGRRRSTRTLHTTIPPTLIINGMIM